MTKPVGDLAGKYEFSVKKTQCPVHAVMCLAVTSQRLLDSTENTRRRRLIIIHIPVFCNPRSSKCAEAYVIIGKP